jgi:hypothetical protein
MRAQKESKISNRYNRGPCHDRDQLREPERGRPLSRVSKNRPSTSESSAPALRRPLRPMLGLPIRLCDSGVAVGVGSFEWLRTVTLECGIWICDSDLPPNDSLRSGVEAAYDADVDSA